MGRHGNPDYGTLASLALVLVGFTGASVGAGTLPGWEITLLTDLEILGVLGLLLCPFVFGIVLPLTE
ncbi:hypothetical protein [Halobacterium zhouii]|uniref:DUF7860 family protein n=1 Tax=Halobacterium zhouii TaxID=2902624 RepID=UPI001E640497|nr:hypothetical protein [Halobacterium zhouii]